MPFRPSRRDFLRCVFGLGLPNLLARNTVPACPCRSLILIELRGGNDGLNTLVPYADPLYYALRPRLAVAPREVLRLDSVVGFNPALAGLMPLWRAGELALLQGLGEPDASLSHHHARTANWDRLAAAQGGRRFVTHVQLDGFDTHENQRSAHDRLLAQLASALVALRQTLIVAGRWDATLILTWSEFGRRPHENASGGTDHGSASCHFALGGRVCGGLYGSASDLRRLDDRGNPYCTAHLSRVHAAAMAHWCGLPRGTSDRYVPIDFLRA